MKQTLEHFFEKDLETVEEKKSYKDFYDFEKIRKSKEQYKDKVEYEDYVECKICGYRAKLLQLHISKIHGIETKEYKKLFNVHRVLINSIGQQKGELNVAFNHGGKLSPFSKKFKNYENLTEDEKEEKLRQIGVLSQDSRNANNNNNCRIDFYTSRGFSEEESKELLSKRQTTFSLEKCIEKYGEELGLIEWQERQEKWIDSLNSKSDDEKIEINRKKSTKINYKTLYGKNILDPGKFYIIRIDENYTKIGITHKLITQRYKRSELKKYLSVEVFDFGTVSDCFELEQTIKKEFKNFKINPIEDINKIGWTEIFKDSYDEIKLFFEEYNKNV
jgi:hypothetical protein